MVVARLSRSGKAVLLVDDFGGVFITSRKYLESLLDGSLPKGVLWFKRLPSGVSQERFGRSVGLGDDSFSFRARGERERDSVVRDLEDW